MRIAMDKEIGAKIKCLRKRKQLTQDQMIAKLQLESIIMSRGTYAKIEAGIRGITVVELKAIKKILNASWESILGE